MDLATLWDPMKADEPGAFAFRAYRNYDGAGARFGETAVRVTGGAAERDVAVYAAERAADGALTVVAVNKTAAEVDTLACLAHFVPRDAIRTFRYDAASPSAIRREPDAQPAFDVCGPNEGTVALRLELSAMSITVLEAFPDRSIRPSASPSAAPTRPSATPTAPIAPTPLPSEAPRLHIHLPFARR